MNIKITCDNSWEDEVHAWYAEASSLGLRPGYFPKKIDTNLGNGQPFQIVGCGDIGVKYRQLFGCIELTIFND